jgi:hypothetical protein
MYRALFLLGMGAVSAIGIGRSMSVAMAVTVTDEAQIMATIESVDQQDRSVLLRGPRGGLVTVVASPDVRNFSQLKPGDRVVVRYREALAANLAKPGTTPPPLQVSQQTQRAPAGDKPAGEVTKTVQARVTITGVDPAHNMVSFVGPAQVQRTVEVLDPDMQTFIKTIKVGDQVDLTYSEALALSVEPVPG